MFSDWLEEHGEFDRAEFIRVQVQRASLPSWDAAQVGLKIREQELLRKHSETWLKRCRKFQGCGGKDFVVESSQWCRSPVSMLCEGPLIFVAPSHRSSLSVFNGRGAASLQRTSANR